MNIDESRKRSGFAFNVGDNNDKPTGNDILTRVHPSSLTLNVRDPEIDGDSRQIKHQRLESKAVPSSEHLVSNISPYDVKSNLLAKESSVSSSHSGSGTDDHCGGATSSSGNPGIVTASTAHNNNASSLSGDDRSSSESAQGSGAGRGHVEEATYYTGYGNGLSIMDSSANSNRASHHHYHHRVNDSQGSDHGGAAFPAAANGGPQQLHRQHQIFANNVATNNMTAQHVLVATDERGLPLHPHALASPLHHHARHNHNHRNNNGSRGEDHVQGHGQGGANTGKITALRATTMSYTESSSLNDIPCAIGGPASQRVRYHRHRSMNQHSEQISSSPGHYELRLPQSDEQAVLQRVPRTHATVVAHDLPPPPTSTDSRSSSSSGSSSRTRRRAAAAASRGQFNTGNTDSIGNHRYSHHTSDSPRALLFDKQNTRSRSGTSDDSSDSAKSETDAVGSGSDEGYAASSERQSGSGSGSDSTSSDYSKKVKGPARGGKNVSLLKVGVPTASRSDSKRTETSSMSSSVLADFSSGMNDELSRSDSPRSSNTSLSSNGGHELDKVVAEAKSVSKPSGSKRNSAQLQSSSSDKPARKKSKPEQNAKHRTEDGFGPTSNVMKRGLSIMEKVLQQKARSANHHHYHSRSTGRKMLEKSFLSAKRDLSTADALSAALASSKQCSERSEDRSIESPGHQMGGFPHYDEASVYSLGSDVMAQVVVFLEPPEIQSLLTSPLSKTWLAVYTEPQGLWKILCTSKPFFAKLDECDSEVSDCSFPMCNDMEMRHLFGRYRLLYTSFVRCMKYLNRLQEDALNGRTPSLDINSNQNDIYPFNKNASLKAYFAKARRLMRSSSRNSESKSSSDAALSITSESGSLGSDEKVGATESGKLASAIAASKMSQPSRQLGRSMLTDRLLRPTRGGSVDNINLPWSCAIYSVVNWMVAFADVEGIQIMCLKCLPYLLEDESQRTTAQRAGLTDSVLRAMVLFPDSIELHTVAFHTLVLLARPLGGNEGMLFHTAMVNTRGIFNNGSSSSKNGIVIMLDSMKRFAQDEILQAMSCWSLVNVALTPLQKSMLVKLGGLTVTSNAMLQHPFNVEVQFRALFALINLVIPTETRPEESEEMREFEREILQQLGEVGETSEKEMLDASVGQISNLVVVAMKNFCSSEAILNRACLVLHNLSLNEEYHSILLWTPNCYQMLEWCLGNYPHDHVLQQSAGGTIQRLNATLSADSDLRARFTHSIRAQQQYSLDLARQEAVLLQEQQRDQEQQ